MNEEEKESEIYDETKKELEKESVSKDETKMWRREKVKFRMK